MFRCVVMGLHAVEQIFQLGVAGVHMVSCELPVFFAKGFSMQCLAELNHSLITLITLVIPITLIIRITVISNPIALTTP